VAAHAPGLVNTLLQARPFAAALKSLGGMAPQREMPNFAPQTFTSWFAGHRPPDPARPLVILWPDTFTNHFLTGTAQAAVEVIEDAGYRVGLPARALCCGRALYDWGMLDRARRYWRETLTVLQREIRLGTPIVGLEPACIAAFRDELPGLFPRDEDAKRLTSQTYMLSEFLEKVDYRPPPLSGKALVHAHCHHSAVIGLAAEKSILDQLGLDYQLLDSGCCGMAGAFGFERDKYAISQIIGEQRLFPAVRQSDPSVMLIADGFSCREQIRQGTGRPTLHLAEVLQEALRRQDPSLSERRAHRSKRHESFQ
jgi:Fe-S oxidoreductase